jgi:hypothetical protein
VAVRHRQVTVSEINFTLHEYCDVYLILGACGNRADAAARAYAERYPARRHPDSNVFSRLDERMRETGNVLPTPPLHRGRPRTRRTPALEETVLGMAAQNPCRSTRGIARKLGVEHRTVHFILQGEDLYPYHHSQVQGLMPHDYHHRLQYREWLLREHDCDPGYLEHILWSDGAPFTLEGVFNSHNSHLLAQHNPHVPREWDYQVRCSINVWADVIDSCVVGPYLLPDRLNGPAYCVLLQEMLPVLLTMCHWWFDVTWFQHDGAPAHFSAQTEQHLNTQFPGRCLGRGGLAGPEHYGLLPLGTPERNCLQGSAE